MIFKAWTGTVMFNLAACSASQGALGLLFSSESWDRGSCLIHVQMHSEGRMDVLCRPAYRGIDLFCISVPWEPFPLGDSRPNRDACGRGKA